MRTLTIVALTVLMLTHTLAQKQYITSMSFDYSTSSMGSGIGNDCGYAVKDVDVQFNKIDGNMEVTVSKSCHTWSFVQHWMGGTYAPSIVFKNRYMELRIRSSAAHDDSLSVGFQVSGGSPDGILGKSIPKINYTINKPDTWETKFFNVGGNADTVFKEVDYFFPNGYYQIDYVYYGDAAVPPLPVMDPVQEQSKSCGCIQSFTVTGIDIPGRIFEGLRMDIKPANPLAFDTLYFDGGGTTLYPDSSQATIFFKVMQHWNPAIDTILITLTDTLRKTSSTYPVKIGSPSAIKEKNEDIKIYPTMVSNTFTIESPTLIKNIEVVDINGRLVYSENTNNVKTFIDLSTFTEGFYLIRIFSDNLITRKIIKL